MPRPRCYVVDEPLANLDPATAGHLLALLRDLADAGHAVVMVEHRVEEALALRPDRVLAMDDGRATYLGPVDGFLAVADPGSVKLPFEIVLDGRARRADGRPAIRAARNRRPRAGTAGVRAEFTSRSGNGRSCAASMPRSGLARSSRSWVRMARARRRCSEPR